MRLVYQVQYQHERGDNPMPDKEVFDSEEAAHRFIAGKLAASIHDLSGRGKLVYYSFTRMNG